MNLMVKWDLGGGGCRNVEGKVQKTKDGTWLRLQIFYPDVAPPFTVVQGMFDLIEQSYPEILRDENLIRTQIEYF